MPTLNWIGKEKVINYDRDVPYRILERQYSYDEKGQHDEDNYSENMIIHGDNLEALKSLLPKYAGSIKCIYIDPPYNTGEENWVYNDNVNDPKIKKWLGEVVGKEGEDLTRHDKWLCMMYPRLNILKKLMHKENGAIFISIDDNEYAHLKDICDEIFGINKHIATIVWQKRYSRENRESIGDVHEYILIYASDVYAFKKNRHLVPMDEKQSKVYKNPNGDPRGRWRPVPMTAQSGHATKDQFYPITAPGGKVHYPPEGRCWSVMENTYFDLLEQGRIYFGKDNNSQPNTIRYLSEVEGVVPWTWWPHEEVGNTDIAKKETYSILGKDLQFETLKPVALISRIINMITDPGDIVLDCFAGTGTTGNAVLEINANEANKRKFILVEMMDYAETITAERVKRVIRGYEAITKSEEFIYKRRLKLKDLENGQKLLDEVRAIAHENKSKYTSVGQPCIKDNSLCVIGKNIFKEKVEGTGGDFSYYELGKPLFIDGQINREVPVEKIKEYIYYTETNQSLETTYNKNEYYMGTNKEAGYYFYYKANVETTLNYDFLSTITERAEQYIVYADKCALSDEELIKSNITFKKIPRDVKIL